MSTNLEFQEKIKLIKKGSVKQVNLTDEERVKAQYELGRYSKHSINFLYSLKDKEIDVAFHIHQLLYEDLVNFLKVVKERNLDITKAKENKASAAILLSHEEQVGANWLTPKERSKLFNDTFNNYQADEFLTDYLEKDLNFDKKIEFRNNKFNNNYDFNEFVEKYTKNIKAFSKKVDLDLIKNHKNYENYLRNSPQFLYFLKHVVTMKTVDFNQLFETMKPILPTPEQRAYKDLILTAIFDEGYHGVEVNDEKVLSKFAQYMQENGLSLDLNKPNTFNNGYLEAKHLLNASNFMESIHDKSAEKFKGNILLVILYYSYARWYH